MNNTFEKDKNLVNNNSKNNVPNIFKKSNFSEQPSNLLNKGFVDGIE